MTALLTFIDLEVIKLSQSSIPMLRETVGPFLSGRLTTNTGIELHYAHTI